MSQFEHLTTWNFWMHIVCQQHFIIINFRQNNLLQAEEN
jgi:hypothetical protein